MKVHEIEKRIKFWNHNVKRNIAFIYFCLYYLRNVGLPSCVYFSPLSFQFMVVLKDTGFNKQTDKNKQKNTYTNAHTYLIVIPESLNNTKFYLMTLKKVELT